MTTTLSKTISALRTILCFQIVFLHAAMTGLTNQELSASYDGSYAIYKYLSTALTLTTRTAVPLFFIISGYLFFINYKNTFIDYKKHLKTRAKHLLQMERLYQRIFRSFQHEHVRRTILVLKESFYYVRIFSPSLVFIQIYKTL